jgi:hypothetical protein
MKSFCGDFQKHINAVKSVDSNIQDSPSPCPHYMGSGHQCYFTIWDHDRCGKEPCGIIHTKPIKETEDGK